jgi:misacylated tRNA(Ala) deacylase
MQTEELFRSDSYLAHCSATVTAVSDSAVYLTRTVFYPTGGGQPGDTGVLADAQGASWTVIEARKGPDGGVMHLLAPGALPPAVGTSVTATIDWDRRHRLMRMHSCLHLLCAIVPEGVTGGSVGDGKGRLDFDMGEAVLEKAAIEEALNTLIKKNAPITARWIADAELAAQPELVRTMSVKPPSGFGQVRLLEIEGIDLQPCGGTHVRMTGEIGPVRVEKIESKGKRNRRVMLVFAE